MSDNQNISTQFEYFFFFLFNTQISIEDDNPLPEPESLKLDSRKQTVKQYGLHFEKDKRLFLRDAPVGEALDNWAVHLQQGWEDICQLYAEHFDNQEVAQNYCHQALFGVALVILDDGESVARHSVHVTSSAQDFPLLRFVKPPSMEFLFRIGKTGESKKACLHQFVPMTSNGRVSRKNLQLRLSPTPQLVPFELGELQPNPVFSVYGLSYGGGGQWKDAVEQVLVQKSLGNKPSLLATVFARLIMGQWQFQRMDEEARELRQTVQRLNNEYHTYAMQKGGIRPRCTSTRALGIQLQKMQSHKSEARLMMSRLGGALQTLDINGDNLANRLEQIQ